MTDGNLHVEAARSSMADTSLPLEAAGPSMIDNNLDVESASPSMTGCDYMYLYSVFCMLCPY
jgi:hypothetical protein